MFVDTSATAHTVTFQAEQAHILFLIDVLYSTHGGAEGVLLKTTRLLPPDRYRCSVATFATRANQVAADHFTCPVHLFPIRRMYDWSALKMAMRLARLIRRERVSIVHSFFPTSDLLGGLTAKLSGCPILISSRRDMGFQRSILHRRAYRLAAGMFDQVHAVADAVRAWHIEQDRLDPKKVVTVYNGVDLEEIDHPHGASPLGEFGLESTSPVIACVANIRPVKAMDVLVRTAAIVRREFPQAHFVVIGQVQDTEYMQQVIELTKQLKVGAGVTFAGPSLRVAAVLKASKVFFLPSHSEGLSNAILEAMACRLPCVATDVGGNRELIEHELNGYLVPIADPAAAARRIVALLQDPEAAQRMGRAGRKIVEDRFSVQAMIGKLSRHYDDLLYKSGIGTGVQGGNHNLVAAGR